MAELSPGDRQKIANGIQRYWSRFWEEIGAVTKGDLLAAIEATDTWIDGNQAAYNAALPQPFRSEATLEQKTFLFCCVAAMRVGIGFLRSLIGEVD